MREKRLYRSCNDRFIAGICGGLAEYFDLDSLLIRLIFVILALSGVSIVFYILAWLWIPIDPACKNQESGAEEMSRTAKKVAENVRETFGKSGHNYKRGDGRVVVGSIILVIGVFTFLESVLHINLWHIVWPLFLVIIGVLIISGSLKRKRE